VFERVFSHPSGDDWEQNKISPAGGHSTTNPDTLPGSSRIDKNGRVRKMLARRFD
jgi:hypothetical protein